MINASLALAVLSASAALSPGHTFLHLHPRLPDTRISVLLDNAAPGFVDIKINGQSYTIESHHNLRVLAPAGTTIYAASTTYGLRPGDVVAQLEKPMDGSHITLR